MDQELQKKLNEQDVKLDAIYKSVEKTRKYFLIIIWVTIIMAVLPMIGLLFAIPKFIGIYSGISGLGL